jgi:uncharacterized OsmC-like protein
MTTLQQSKLNGIDTQTLQEFIGTVQRNPAAGLARFHATTAWAGGTTTQSHITSWSLGGKNMPRNFTIATDEPPELCGQSTAPNPQEVLFAALNACMIVGYSALCALHGIELESLEIETEGELDLRGFLGIDADVKPGYHNVDYIVRIKGNGTPEQFEQIHKAVMATSPNFSNISSPIQMNSKLIVE